MISPDGVETSQIVGVSASYTFPSTIKSRFLLVPAHLVSPRKRGRKTVVCVCVYFSLCKRL